MGAVFKGASGHRTIELAAATLLAGHAPASVLAETSSQADLEDARQRGHLWAAQAEDVPVGFAHIEVLEPGLGIAHLEEIANFSPQSFLLRRGAAGLFAAPLQSVAAPGSRWPWDNCCTMRPSMAFIIGDRLHCC